MRTREKLRKRRPIRCQRGQFNPFPVRIRKFVLPVLFIFSFSLLPTGVFAQPKPEEATPSQLGGNFRHQNSDLVLEGSPFRLSVVRTYNSRLNSYRGLFGYGWCSFFDTRVFESEHKKQIYAVESDGSILTFRFDPERGKYCSKQYGRQTIEKHLDGRYVRTVTGGLNYHFGPTGLFERLVDRNGNEIVCSYDSVGRLQRVTTSTGQALTFTYDKEGHLRRISDPLGRGYTYLINLSGDLTRYTDPGGRSTGYRYDSDHNLTEIRFADGARKEITYDTAGNRVLTESGPGTFRRSFDYDLKSGTIAITDGNGHTSRITYGNGFRKQVIEDPLGAKTTYEFQEDWLLVLRCDADGNESTFEYDDRGNLVSTTNALGYQYRVEYHPTLNLPVKLFLPEGLFEEIVYDDRGNVVAVVDPAGLRYELTYDQWGNVREHTQPGGYRTSFDYDGNGNVVKAWDDLGVLFEAEFNAAGQPVKRAFRDGSSIAFSYSPSGDVTVLTDANGRTVRFVYDDMGRLIMGADAKGNRTRFDYDEAGQLTSKVNALGSKTAFHYDASGNLVEVIDANDNSTRFKYDPRNLPIEEIDAAGNKVQYTYDAAGRKASVTDASGNTIRYRYDPAGRLIEKRHQTGDSVRFTYDPAGRVTSIQGPQTALSFEYDSAQRLASRRDDFAGFSLNYAYDERGLIETKKTSDGKRVGQTYDIRGRLATVVDPIGGTTRYHYNAGDRLMLLERPNGTFSRCSYDAFGRLSDIRHENAKGDVLASVQYTFDPLDYRITATFDNEPTRRYSYDAAGQLVEESTDSGPSVSYRYDAAGNRIEVSGERYTYDRLNRLIEGGGNMYVYDVNGNLIEKVTGQDKTSYAYDADGNLSSVELPDGKTYKYGYDVFGNRVSRSGPEGKTYAFHEGEDVFAELSSDRCVKRLFVHGPGIDNILSVHLDDGMYQVYADGLDSVIALADEAGSIVSRYAYSTWGEVRTIEERFPMPFLFTGARHDAESGLHYLRTRGYDPKAGRFISPDIIGLAGGINLYRYAINNPVNFTDPWGTLAAWVTGAIGALVGGVVNGASAAYQNWDKPSDVFWNEVKGGVTEGVVSGATQGFIVGACVDPTDAATAFIAYGALGGGLGNALGSVAGQWMAGKEISGWEALKKGGIGTLTGALGGLASKGVNTLVQKLQEYGAALASKSIFIAAGQNLTQAESNAFVKNLAENFTKGMDFLDLSKFWIDDVALAAVSETAQEAIEIAISDDKSKPGDVKPKPGDVKPKPGDDNKLQDAVEACAQQGA